MFSAVAVGDTDAIRAIVAHAPEQLDRAMDRTNHRRRPLHLAVVKKQPAAVETLLALGADVDATDAAGLTALDQAALDGGREMAQALIAGGATIRLASAIFLERHEDVARLLREDPDCLKPGGRWSTLIVRAAGRAPGHLVAALITNGAAVNMIDDEQTAVDQTGGYTPLHAAAWEGNVDAAAVLLEHGADPRIRDTKYCGTPAGWANYNGKAACRDLILQSGRIDIFDAITLDRPDLIRPILKRDPEGVLGHMAITPTASLRRLT